jgi:hypothetical protein
MGMKATSVDFIDAGTRNDRCPLAEVLGQVMGSVERLWPGFEPPDVQLGKMGIVLFSVI